MPITSHIDKTRDVTLFSVAGELRYADVIAAVETFYAGKTTRYVLWNFLETTKNSITPEQAEKLLLLKQRYEGKKKKGKTAIVAHDDFFFGMSRSLALQSNLLDARYMVMVFNNPDTAYKWFDEP